MTSSATSKPTRPSSPATSAALSSPRSFRNRRGSTISISSTIDKERLAHALDEIHTSASRCDSLTTFNDFAPPPEGIPSSESRQGAGELVQNGLSGLYNRFREAVSGASPIKTAAKEAKNNKGGSMQPLEAISKRSSVTPSHTSRPSVSSLTGVDTNATVTTLSTGGSPMAEAYPSAAFSVSGDTRSHGQQSTKSNSISLMTGPRSSSSSRQSLPTKATSSVIADPTIAPPVALKRDASRSTIQTEDSAGQASGRRSLGRAELQVETAGLYDSQGGRLPPRARRDDASSAEASVDAPFSPVKASSPSVTSALPSRHHVRNPSVTSSVLPMDDYRRTPAVIDRISHSRSPIYADSRESSVDRGTAAASAVSTSAHGSVYHDSFAREYRAGHLHPDSGRIPGTTRGHERASDQMSAQLDKMRRQVLSKEFWMKDDTVKECFLCQVPFTAFRRKHHCRTCGCIFDSKCTTVVSGEKFGVQGSLRVCKNCLEVITRRFDGSGSDDSGDDERSFLPKIFGPNNPKDSPETVVSKSKPSSAAAGSEGSEDSRSLTTPMMAIPATRRVRDPAYRASAVLEIDAPQLSRPGSSRSLKSLTASGRPQSSAGHRRHHSKHGLLGRFKPAPEQQAPFRKGIGDENSKKPKFPAFHDDNIIDPDLADYMSEDSSADEQMGIFATMTGPDVQSTSYEQDRSGFPSYMNQARKHRQRHEKSISGMSYASRGVLDDASGPISYLNHRRSTRRRNLSNVSGSAHHHASPRPKSAVYKGPSVSAEMLFGVDHPSPGHSGTQLTRSDSLRKNMSPEKELNESSLKHVDKILHQLLDDAEISNPGAWQKALVPILLQLTDDVTPDVAKGEDMDLRHYVKLKKIPGGRPGDTCYVSGVVFTKNLALKSMPRRITNPRIVLVTFPIEYQRHQQHFMSLQPVIEQEKEFLRVVVQRITNLRPQVLLAQKGVSGVALQYLSEANISVAYNVKDTVIEAVARCAEAEIIESLDMLALPVRVGRCSAFEVRTFVNNDNPGRKKSYIFISGCRPDLGCTIALRGATGKLLKHIKHIMEFMVYVVYNLKLESSLLRDESVEPPEDSETSLSNSLQGLNDSVRSVSSGGEYGKGGPTMVINHASSESEPPSQVTVDSLSTGNDEVESSGQLVTKGKEPGQLVSLHASHLHASSDSQVPDDVPMPTFYSDMVAKYETKILSASPYVKFKQPYLLMRAREQERRLLYLRRLRDQDAVEEDSEKAGRHKFQLIKPEMVEKIGQKAPRQVMEVLHAVHDAEYDKALFNYQTQTRQWETYIQGNLDLFDPYSHQNIVVLYSVICTDTKIPCIEPGLVAINFYDEQHVDTGMDADCTLGQYIEDLAYSKNDICNSNGCEKKLVDHHRTYVHDEYRITVFVEHVANPPPRRPELGDGVTMWTYCKLCKKDSEEVAMSDATFKYSFGKYLELLYWGRGLRIKNVEDCPHDQHRDHVRYFSVRDSRVRIHWDPIDLLEIVVPRARITWKVANDLKLKNEIYNKMEERWGKFMSSVRARLKSIRTESLLPEKAESCKAEVERLMKKTQDEQPAIIRQMQRTYVESKYYEVVPFNKIAREMLEKAGEWDQAFAKFEADFLGDRDMRQITMMQLKKIFTDNESKESLASNEGTGSAVDSDERPSQPSTEAAEKSSQPAECTDTGTEASIASSGALDEKHGGEEEKVYIPAEGAIERVEGLDLAGPQDLVATPAPVSQDFTASETASRIPIAQNPTTARPPISPTGAGHSPTDFSISGQSLSEKVDQMRREQALQGNEGLVTAPKPAPVRGPSRKSGPNISPPLVRAVSQPARSLSRSHSAATKTQAMTDSRPAPGLEVSIGEPPEGSIRVDKKLSDRLGLTALKNRGKNAASSIPRLAHKKRESKVSTLARHFEQLSREFEKERIRDRKERAASLRQPRARLPRTFTKAIVQVYDDVAEAFEEHNLYSNEQLAGRDGDQSQMKAPTKEKVDVLKSEPGTPLPSPQEASVKPEDQASKSEHDLVPESEINQATSDDEGATSDMEPSIADEFLPDIQELAEALEPSTEIPLELPKHQKTSLMKYLTNFWAETSASGWPPLEYPVNSSDHIFVDSDIIVREDEPSSVIALALSSDDYQNKLSTIRKDAQEVMQREVEGTSDGEPKYLPASEAGDFTIDEAELEKSLLRATGTHLKYQFKEGAAMMTCKIFYAEQFDALRRKCGIAERIIECLSRCLKWDSRGGKTKSVFLKTLDDRLVLKSLSPVETSAFLRFAPGYFSIMAEALFHDLPSVIAKMLGFFQVIIKNPSTGIDIKLDLLVTENLFYDRCPTRIFDLKGSMRNRKIQSTGEQNEVLLDENMVEYIYESPLFAREHSKKLLRASVWNDTLFLARQNVMDYSLMIAVDEERKELVVGIIDCIRTYTWDKKLESWIKDRGFAGGGRNRPTVTSPKEYKSRFREAMARYILQAPNCWHLFNNPQLSTNYGHARFEEPETAA